MNSFQKKLTEKFEGFTNEQLIDIYSISPDRIVTALVDLSELYLTSRPRGEQTWTIFDIVCHLADSEAIGFTRISKVYLQDTTETIANYPRLVLYNQELWACDAPYHLDLQFLDTKFELFKSLRKNNTLLFNQLVESDWVKRGTHLEYGQITLRFLLELYANHGELHLKQILSIRDLLGKSLELEELLPVLQ